MRMSIGRKMREYSHTATNRGYPNQVGNWIEYQKRQRTNIQEEGNALRSCSKNKNLSPSKV